ncbi:MAG: transposase [candidate division Zixibacteria bacterium]|nr:transposase [Candidatus Tariuqbacter arcticus]
MPQYRRLYQSGGYYFFTLVTHERRKFLTDELARKCLRDAWLTVRSKRPFNLIALCLLPDHLHCIWKLPDNDCDFSQRWSSIKSLFSRNYLKLEGIEGNRTKSRMSKAERAIWQRRFFEHLIKNEDDLNRRIDYIHYNPLKHRLVERLADWKWSTFHKYMKNGYYIDYDDIESPGDLELE